MELTEKDYKVIAENVARRMVNELFSSFGNQYEGVIERYLEQVASGYSHYRYSEFEGYRGTIEFEDVTITVALDDKKRLYVSKVTGFVDTKEEARSQWGEVMKCIDEINRSDFSFDKVVMSGR